MRITHTELASAAALRLKALLPTLHGIPGAAQAELFILYSSLKYLSMELERLEPASRRKADAAEVLKRELAALVAHPAAPACAGRLAPLLDSAFGAADATEPLGDRRVDVAAIVDVLRQGSEPVGDQHAVMAALSQYLHDINQADLDVYR